jgi:D-amino peptidase
VAGVERLDALTVRLVDEDPIRLYQRFITVVLLTRGMTE